MSYYPDENLFNNYQELQNIFNNIGVSAFEPIAEFAHVSHKTIESLYASVGSISYAFLQNFYDIYSNILSSHMEQIQKAFDFYNVLSQHYIEAVNNFSAIAQPLAEALGSIDFDALFASIQSEIINENPEDYIITDSPVIKEFDISDNIAIPVGHNRIRMKTGDFICLLSLLFAIFAYFFPHNDNEVLPESASHLQDTIPSAEIQIPSQEDTVLLLQEQNQLLLDILESIDASMSSQADLLEDIKEALQEQASKFQTYQEAFELNQMSLDSDEVFPDTVPASEDQTQMTFDNTPESPNIISESE